MYGPSSFNSFPPQFSAVYEPTTPICSMNAMNIAGLAGGGQEPAGWTILNGTVDFGTDGTRNT